MREGEKSGGRSAPGGSMTSDIDVTSADGLKVHEVGDAMFFVVIFVKYFIEYRVDVPEWLSGMTRNHVGSARAGSNPAVHVFL